ncbi:MAG: hypothetical protein ACRDE7_05580 [Sphingobacterium sp.]
MIHDLEGYKMLYKYVASPKTYCYYTNTLVMVGDRVFYKGEELGEVAREIHEEAEKKYKHHGDFWQEISLT